MLNLEGRVCVVTGGAHGIGLALCRRFQAAGMKVAIGDIEPATLDSAVEKLQKVSPEVLGVRCDVSRAEDVHRLRDAVADRFGSAQVVCLNAGVAPVGSLLDTSLETWRWLLDVNVMGVVHGIDAFGADLVAQGEGHFVLTASAAGLLSAPVLGAYGATKHAVVGIAGALRDELQPSGVGVSVLCPGLVKTRIFESERNRPHHRGAGHGDTEAAGSMRDIIQHGVDPAEVADAVHRAVVEGTLFVIPTTDVREMIERRIQEVAAALPSG